MRPGAMAVAVCVTAWMVLLVCLAAPDATAAPRQYQALQGSDLVVQEIIIREEGVGEFHDVHIVVRVKNQGGAAAGRTMTALVFSQDVGAGATVLTRPTPGLPGGASHELEFVIEGIAGNFAGVLVAIADAPVSGNNYGQVREGTPSPASRVILPPIDANNTFGVICTTVGRTLPLRIVNPLAK